MAMQVAAPQLHTMTSDVLQLWSLKAKLAKGHPFSVFKDIHHAALDAIWATAFGSDVGTTKSQTGCLASLPDTGVDLPVNKDSPVELPKAPTPAVFNAILVCSLSI